MHEGDTKTTNIFQRKDNRFLYSHAAQVCLRTLGLRELCRHPRALERSFIRRSCSKCKLRSNCRIVNAPSAFVAPSVRHTTAILKHHDSRPRMRFKFLIYTCILERLENITGTHEVPRRICQTFAHGPQCQRVASSLGNSTGPVAIVLTTLKSYGF